MKQMTPVEWLVDKICGTHTKSWQPEIDQALEMEKQEMATNSSQPVTDNHALEISDEEIEKAAYNFCNLSMTLVAFIEGAKWYREQLKQRK
jgi:hypothetical protein